MPIILDLRAQIGRGVDECPTFAIAREGEADHVRGHTRSSPAPAIRHTLQLQFLRNAAICRRTD